jgi:hypothetical protein
MNIIEGSHHFIMHTYTVLLTSQAMFHYQAFFTSLAPRQPSQYMATTFYYPDQLFSKTASELLTSKANKPEHHSFPEQHLPNSSHSY